MAAEIYRTSETCCIFCPAAVSEIDELFGTVSGCSPRSPVREYNARPTFRPNGSEGLVITASLSRLAPSVSLNLGSAMPRKKRDVE